MARLSDILDQFNYIHWQNIEKLSDNDIVKRYAGVSCEDKPNYIGAANVYNIYKRI